ncbi:hypothetical protein BDW68DRAFT_182807 [Aspergillus falconensis]
MDHSSVEKTTPERLITTTSSTPNGYGTSKYVAEHILAHATSPQTRNLRTAFARVGQIAGAANAPGLWNKTEWFPSLVLSSLHRVRGNIERLGGDDGNLQAALEENPAAKLIAFFESLAASANAWPDNILETRETAKRSEKLGGVPGVGREWIKWIMGLLE